MVYLTKKRMAIIQTGGITIGSVVIVIIVILGLFK